MSWLLAAAAGYLIGSISFARIIGSLILPGRRLDRTEFTESGEGPVWVYDGVSATSVTHHAGARWGMLVVLLDAAKAFLPTLIVRSIWPDSGIYLLVALAVVSGHVWPVLHRFRGGRGQSPILGALVAIDFLAIPASIAIAAFVGLVVFTSAFLAREGFGLWVWAWFALKSGWGPEPAFGVAVGVLYAVALLPDIREDRRVERAAGRLERPWRGRLRASVHQFVGKDPD